MPSHHGLEAFDWLTEKGVRLVIVVENLRLFLEKVVCCWWWYPHEVADTVDLSAFKVYFRGYFRF